MSDEITISCPHCNGESSVNANCSGQVVVCPHCSGKLTVPGLRPVSPAPMSPVPMSPAPMSPAPMSPPNSQGVPEAVIAPLARTQGWARFLSILGFIGCGLLVLAGLWMMVVGSRVFDYSGAAGMGIFIGLIYLVLAGLYLFPALKLTQYANRIASLRASHAEQDLVSALDAQRSFWTFVGIMAIVTIGLYILGILIAVIFGAGFLDESTVGAAF